MATPKPRRSRATTEREAALMVDHIAELGRRFGPSLRGNEKPILRVIEGGQT